MSENEVLTETNATPEPENANLSKGGKFVAALKEHARKFAVKLKRRPMNIAFFVLFISTAVYLLLLGSISQAGLEYAKTGVPIAIFVNTLFGILVLLLFMYSFPKRSKKPKIVMLVFTFVFMAVMIAMDILLYVQWNKAWAEALEILNASQKAEREKYIYNALNGVLAHAVLVAVSAVLTATYPLYGKLIAKINTRKTLEENVIKEEIDTSEEV